MYGRTAIAAFIISSFLFASGCVEPEPAMPAYNPESFAIEKLTSEIPEAAVQTVKKEIADCGDVTVDVVSATADIPNHYHRISNEVAVFLEGGGEFAFEGRDPIRVKPGMVLFIPKNQMHSFKSDGGRYTVVRIFAPHFESNDMIKVEDIKEKQ